MSTPEEGFIAVPPNVVPQAQGESGVHDAVRTYRGLNAAERQHERRLKLVAAGLQLFGTRGITGTRVQDICAEAHLTKRYFYESFNSPDDLVHAVVQEVLAELTVKIVPMIAAGGWHDPGPALRVFVGALLADPRLIRLLVIETHSGALTSYRQAFIDRAVDTWLAADSKTDPDPSYLPTQRLLAYAYAGAVGEVAVAWANDRIDLPVDVLTEHLIRIFKRIAPRTTSETGSVRSSG